MELLDIVDENDKVIGTASQEEALSKKLRRRMVHVLMFDKQGRLALQMRGKDCSFCPHHWSTSVGGHVQSGESYEQAANREFKEELGVINALSFFSKDYFISKTGLQMFLVTYKTIFEGPFELEEGKVDKVEYFTIEEIRNMIDNNEKFHPELLFLLKKHFL